MKDGLSVQNIYFAYAGVPVISELSFSVGCGELFAVIGPNGAGKTTLLRLLGGSLAPLSGAITLDGTPVRALNARRRARRMAVVGQETHLDFAFTVEEVVLMGRYPHLPRFGHEGPMDREIARRAMADVGVEHLASRLITTVSGGERQRVLLARALAQEPECLLLDEPVAHLDLNHQIAVMDLLLKLSRAQRITVVGVFHDLNLAGLYADRVLLLVGGRNLALGAAAEVITPELILRAYRGAVMVADHPKAGRPQVMLLPGRAGSVEG
jgi:iron complex transport system ATP-binding protein